MIQKIVKYPEFVKIDETDFNNAYARLVNNCLMFGMEQKYGNVHRIDITGATVLTGNAMESGPKWCQPQFTADPIQYHLRTPGIMFLVHRWCRRKNPRY